MSCITKSPSEQKTGHNVHDLKLVIPITPQNTKPAHDHPSVVVAFNFPEKAELGPRVRFDCYWDTVTGSLSLGDKPCLRLRFPSDNGSVLQQILSIAKEVNWKGSIREHMMWQRYIVTYAQRGAPKGG